MQSEHQAFAQSAPGQTPLQRLRSVLPQDTDAVLLTDPVHQYYFTNFMFADGYVAIGREAAYLFTDFRYIEAAENAMRLTPFTVQPFTAPQKIAAFLQSSGVSRLSFEDAHLTVADLEKWKRHMSAAQITLTPIGDLISRLRRRKSPDEIEAIVTAQKFTDDAYLHILDYLRENAGHVTEKQVALELEFFMRQAGAEGLSFDVIAVSGDASALPHGVPRDCLLQPGFLTMDFGCKYRGYCSDMTRTVCLGAPDSEMERVYRTVLEAQNAALEALHVGMSCAEADRTARAVIDRAGYAGCFGHALGHGVGLHIHESPVFSPAAPDSMLLSEGDVVTVEPGIYLTGKYGVRIEDMITVQNGEIRNLTHSPKQLVQIDI